MFIVSILWAWGFFLFDNFFCLTVNWCVISKYLLTLCCFVLLKISNIFKFNSRTSFCMNKRLACIINSKHFSNMFDVHFACLSLVAV